MNWGDWNQWVKKHQRKTGWLEVMSMFPPPFDYRLMEEAHRQIQDRLDALIRAYAASPARWPRMDSLERVMLYFRFEHARKTVALLATPVDFGRHDAFLPPPQDFEQTVIWLLIVTWHRHGWSDWRNEWELRTLQAPPAGEPSLERPNDGFAV